MDVALVKATKISELIDKLNKRSSDISIKSCLNVCSAYYGVAIDNLQRAIHVFELGTYKDSDEFLATAVEALGDCEDTFSEPQIHRKSPLTATNAYFASMATITEDILSIFMKPKSP
ncbi:putative invertase inhibitor [Henckelia pumila]|uniref:putative invertase inhibitor n=1 Tax=Henckelia pumila TaxID=405737 RepID=UPI003C6E839D